MKRWRVLVFDNFNFMDEDEGCDEKGPFSTYAEALAEAQRIVDGSLRWLRQECEDPMDPGELYERYKDFGDDPSIAPNGPKNTFHAWDYAKERCKAICAEPVPRCKGRKAGRVGTDVGMPAAPGSRRKKC